MEDIIIQEESKEDLANDRLQDCVDLEIYRRHLTDYSTGECLSNFLVHVQEGQKTYLNLKSSRKIKFRENYVNQLELQPGFTHLYWCCPELSSLGLDVFISHKAKIRCREIFNDLIISPSDKQHIITVSLRKWAQNLESEYCEGKLRAKPVPISPPYIGIRYSTDRVNFLLNKHQILSLENSKILDSLARNTHCTQSFIPLTEGYRKSWYQRNLAHLKDICHMRITRGGLRSLSGPILVPVEETIPGRSEKVNEYLSYQYVI
jgi:hypothetical protein